MVILKQPEEIKKIRDCNRVVAEILKELKRAVRPGITTRELDKIAEDLSTRKKVKPAFKGYMGYPYALCTSVNEEVVHGLPSNRVLIEGDIIGLDFGVFQGGYYGDAAITVPVGKISELAANLLKVTAQGLEEAISVAKAGNRLGDISFTVQNRAEAAGYSVVRDFVGHGIGRSLHEDPQIPNFGVRGRGMELRVGMVLAIEPMVNAGTYRVKVKSDDWTVITEDAGLSAHFEHSVAVTEEGPVILSEMH